MPWYTSPGARPPDLTQGGCRSEVKISALSQQDVALMERIHSGDAAAFRQLSDDHLNSIVRFAFRIVHNHAEAEDIAQETFLRAWQRAGDFEPARFNSHVYDCEVEGTIPADLDGVFYRVGAEWFYLARRAV